MTKVFISREQTRDSFFKRYLEEKGLQVIAKSLVAFLPLEINSIPEADWIFFYSKNGVRYFFYNQKKLNQPLSEHLRFGTIGKGTAKELANFGITADFIGTGEPATTAEQFSPLAMGKKVIFPQAEQSRQSIQKLLAGAIDIIPLIVYKNEIKTDIQIPPCDLLVFTSPLNAEAFFNHYTLTSEQKLVAIGQTTAKALNNLSSAKVYVASEPSEEGLAKVVVDILKLD